MADTDPFGRTSSEFLTWFKSSPGARLSPKISLADLRSRDAGRGIVASEDIAEDDELFAVPRTLVLQKTTSDVFSKLPDAFADLGPWDSLILVVIYEYLRADTSPWFPYLRLLPTTFNSLMFWSPKELEELQGSAVLDKIGRASAEEQWRETILPVMESNKLLFPVSGAHVVEKEGRLLELAHMAGSMIMAYAFDLEDTESSETGDDTLDEGVSDLTEDDEENLAKGMVPFADMLNADATRSNAKLFHENDHLVMRATTAIGAGNEILNHYGDLPRSDLLRMYGYLTNKYSQFDVVEISADLIQAVAASSGENGSYLTEQRSDLEGSGFIDDAFILERPKHGARLQDVVPVDLRMLITAFCRPAEKFSASNSTKYAKESGLSLSEASLLSATIINRLSAYKSSLQDDQQILEKLDAGELPLPADQISSKRYRMALQVRTGEKEILYQALNLLQEHISQETHRRAGDSMKRKWIDINPSPTNKKFHKSIMLKDYLCGHEVCTMTQCGVNQEKLSKTDIPSRGKAEAQAKESWLSRQTAFMGGIYGELALSELAAFQSSGSFVASSLPSAKAKSYCC